LAVHQVAIIGAGPAGISAALSLHDRGRRPLLIDRAEWAPRGGGVVDARRSACRAGLR
jgi:2-polyprenyl-6-methoxyphenol hydroxylase-like FAD-dependent oxidoreductase